MTDTEEKRKKLVATLTALVGAEKANQMVNKLDENIHASVLAVAEILKKGEGRAN